MGSKWAGLGDHPQSIGRPLESVSRGWHDRQSHGTTEGQGPCHREGAGRGQGQQVWAGLRSVLEVVRGAQGTLGLTDPLGPPELPETCQDHGYSVYSERSQTDVCPGKAPGGRGWGGWLSPPRVTVWTVWQHTRSPASQGSSPEPRCWGVDMEGPCGGP